MIYPEDFKERVKKAYPNSSAIAEALEKGDDEQLKYLLCSEISIPPELTIDEALEYQSETCQRQLDVTFEFMKMYAKEHYKTEINESQTNKK